ncbi:MAG: hypothetical protein ACPL68_07540, partial [Candidatus Hydrothermia bacterium]
MDAILRIYVQEINRIYKQGDFSEMSFRSPLEELFRQCLSKYPEYEIIHEATGQTPGTPDFVIRRGAFPAGFCECKAIEKDLP